MLTQARVLLVSREGPDTQVLRQVLTSVGHESAQTESVATAAAGLAQGEYEVAVLVHETHGLDDLERLVAAASASPGVAFVVLADAAAASATREAMRLGASEVVERSAGEDALVIAIERAVRDGQRVRELAMLRARVGEDAQHALVGRSTGMARIRELVGRAAASRSTVLITGEPGTGKDVVARLVHDLSDRATRPYVTVRCGHADPEALELELFGRVASASGGARAGLLEEARGGTVVLDDAAGLPPSLRAQLARAAATRTTRRIGGTASLPADVRVILTSRSQADGGADGSHEDLLSRFNAMPIVLPPLRERRSDVPQLVQHFRSRFAAEHGVELAALSPEEMLPLLGHEWSGNVRELEHWVERTAMASSGERPNGHGGESADLGGIDLGAARATLEQLERAYILHVLAQESGHQSRASVRLGIDRRTLYRKLKQYRNDAVQLQRAG